MAKPTRVLPGQTDMEETGRHKQTHPRDMLGTTGIHKDVRVSSTDAMRVGGVSGQQPPTDLSDAVGSQLRTAYSELLKDPVPDKFSALLERLAKAEKDAEEPHS